MRSRLQAVAAVLVGAAIAVVQPVAAASENGTASRHHPASIILFTGQSNAGGGGSGGAILTAPVHPERVFSFRSARQSYGSARLDPARMAALGPLSDDPRGSAFPATAMAEALASLDPGTYFSTPLGTAVAPSPTSPPAARPSPT